MSDIDTFFRSVVKYPSIEYPEKVHRYIDFPTIMWFEPKYDGSNIAVWVYNGELIISSRRRAVADKTLFDGALSALSIYTKAEKLRDFLAEKKLVFYGELYGYKNTPMGYHKNHDKPLDIVIFDVLDIEKNAFVEPSKAEEYASRVGLPFVSFKPDLIEDLGQLIDSANQHAGFEGCVIKIYDESYRKGALMMKWKPQELEVLEGELPLSEIFGVVAKALQDGLITIDMPDKKKFRILRKLVEEEAEKHGLRPPKNKNVIYRAYSLVSQRVIFDKSVAKALNVEL